MPLGGHRSLTYVGLVQQKVHGKINKAINHVLYTFTMYFLIYKVQYYFL